MKICAGAATCPNKECVHRVPHEGMAACENLVCYTEAIRRDPKPLCVPVKMVRRCERHEVCPIQACPHIRPHLLAATCDRGPCKRFGRGMRVCCKESTP